MANRYSYALIFADEPPELVGDDVRTAVAWMIETVKDLKRQGYIPAWRAVGLLRQIGEMPKQYYSFTVQGIGKIAYERRRTT